MTAADFARDLDQHRGNLLRVGRPRLRDRPLAEDVLALLPPASKSGFKVAIQLGELAKPVRAEES